MSQAGIVDIEGSHPQIPTSFVTNNGTAIPIVNTLEILGTVVAAHSIPLETTGSGNTVTIEAQYASASASSVGTNAGLASFNSTYFSVDANGFVTLNGSSVGETITGNTGGALSPTAGNWNILGTSTAAGTTPVQTSGSGSTLTVQVQKAQAIASTNATNVGLAAFNSANFTVDANGFVSLIPSSVTEAFMVDAFTAPGTNPVQPNVSGIVTVTGGQVAAGTTTNVIRTDSLAVNTYTIQIQRSQAVASSTIGDNGVSHFNSADFSVDANGFVSLTGSVALTFDGDSGSATPSGGIITFNANANSGSSVRFSASGAQVNLSTTDGLSNTTIGIGAGNISVSGTDNTSLGYTSLNLISYGVRNSCCGSHSMAQVTGGSFNSALGYYSLASLVSGNINTALGYLAGIAYTSSESSNIMIANEGVIGESNVTRIGTQFAGGTGQNICYIAGITGATPVSAHTPQVVLCDNAGNLTPISSNTSGFVLTSNGTATPSFQASSGGTVTSVSGTPNRITSTGGTTPVIDISASYVGQTSITTLGTVTTGTWNANTITVPNGGTGDVSFTAYAPICGGTTSTGVLQSVASVGTAGQVLTSNGPSALPSFQPSSSSGSIVSAYLATTMSNVTGDGSNVIVIFDSTFVNQGGNYNTTTGLFTAPITGNYFYSYQLTFAGVTSTNTNGFMVGQINSSNTINSYFNPFNDFAPTQGVETITQTGIVPLIAGNTFNVLAVIQGGTKTVSVFGLAAGVATTTLSIFLI